MNNYKPYFLKTVRETFPDCFREIIAETENNYKQISLDTSFAKTSANPVDRRLDFCAYFLALIKTLDNKGETYEVIRKICLDIVIDYVRPKNKLQKFIKRTPIQLIDTWLGKKVIEAFAKRVSKNDNNGGFIVNIITDKQETFGLGYGIDIIECGICKLFKKHNFYKYASILCEVDELTSSLAGLKLIRTGTIANGAKKCDFRFKKL